MMSESELDDGGAALAAVAGAPVSAHNEAKVRAMLLKAAHDMLSRYPTTLWEDKQTVLEFAEANPADDDDEGGGGGGGGGRGGGGDGDGVGGEAVEGRKVSGGEKASPTPTSSSPPSPPPLSKHVRLAVMMRIHEKTTLMAAARLLLKELPTEMVREGGPFPPVHACTRF